MARRRGEANQANRSWAPPTEQRKLVTPGVLLAGRQRPARRAEAKVEEETAIAWAPVGRGQRAVPVTVAPFQQRRGRARGVGLGAGARVVGVAVVVRAGALVGAGSPSQGWSTRATPATSRTGTRARARRRRRRGGLGRELIERERTGRSGAGSAGSSRPHIGQVGKPVEDVPHSAHLVATPTPVVLSAVTIAAA
ncbi:hypothetical protein GCM10009815_07850 [Nocardioides marmoribigeumensis]